MSEQQDVFEVWELATLSFKCSHCGTVIMFDMATKDTHGLPKRCSTCNESLGAGALDRFQKAMKRVVAVPHAEIQKRIEAHRQEAARNPNRRGPKKRKLG